MKAIPTLLLDHIGSDLTTLTTCWELRRSDGVVLRFTEHDEDVVLNDTSAGVEGVYTSSEGYTSSSISNNLDLSVDQLDVLGVLGSSGVTQEDLQAGLFDHAEVRIFMLNWKSPDDGIIKLRRGWLGEVTIKDGQFIAELRGLANALQEPTGETYGSTCKASFGDARCGINVDPDIWVASTSYVERTSKDFKSGDTVSPTTPNGFVFKCIKPGLSGSSEPLWVQSSGSTTTDNAVVWEAVRAYKNYGTVLSDSSDRYNFSNSDISFPNGWFDGGVVTWITGVNAGRQMEVKSYDGTNIELVLPMPNDILAGDTFSVIAGCLKRHIEDCNDKFDNVYNIRSFPHIPGYDAVTKFGGQ